MSQAHSKTLRAACTLAAASFVLAVRLSSAAAQSPAPAASAPAAPPAARTVEYKLRSTDKINISFEQLPGTLNRAQRIEANGTVDLAWIGPLKIAGMTKVEAQKAIEYAYGPLGARMLRAAKVTIFVEEYGATRASIPKNVNTPGNVVLSPELAQDLVEVILKAGGVSELGKGSAVTVVRKLPDGTTRTLGPFNVDAMTKGNDPRNPRSQAPIIEPDDIIIIPDRII